MSFVLQGFSTVSVTANTRSPREFAYSTVLDTLATIIASGYFNDVVKHFRIHDTIYIVGTDAEGLYKITNVTPNVTLAPVPVADATITLAKLATGIAPSHVVKFAGKHQYNGGGTSSVNGTVGVLTSDIVIASLQDCTTMTTLKAKATAADNITFTYGADPGAGTVVSFIVLRAAA